ncbi:cysteine-rich venom protein [Pagrus major]|uniref:cysteine-rich venom protein n=1 Tax=Pagrus major TaxID=143350 RepID=UPI003CC8D648
MFALLISVLTLHHVHAACNVTELCPATNETVQNEIVNLHNHFRRNVSPNATNMLKMNYSDEVAVSAQAWVDRCILAHGAPSTRTLKGYELGENLFYSSKPLSWTDVITAWHNEESKFTYPLGDWKTTGHYTQVVWNSSYRVGCGMTYCTNDDVYFYACHYYRAGNFRGWPPYKNGESCASCPDDCEDKLCTNPCPYINHFLNCPNMKKTTGCGNKWVSAWCPASCKCPTEIIPIG